MPKSNFDIINNLLTFANLKLKLHLDDKERRGAFLQPLLFYQIIGLCLCMFELW